MWRLRRKTERGWHDGFHINKGDEAKGLCDLLNSLERERDEWKALATQYSFEREHNAMQALAYEAERDEARGQRDMLAAALINCMPFISGEGCGEYSDAKLALQSLTTNEP
jgi:hypothetical protein